MLPPGVPARWGSVRSAVMLDRRPFYDQPRVMECAPGAQRSQRELRRRSSLCERLSQSPYRTRWTTCCKLQEREDMSTLSARTTYDYNSYRLHHTYMLKGGPTEDFEIRPEHHDSGGLGAVASLGAGCRRRYARGLHLMFSVQLYACDGRRRRGDPVARGAPDTHQKYLVAGRAPSLHHAHPPTPRPSTEAVRGPQNWLTCRVQCIKTS
jgi:hypothetical protein